MENIFTVLALVFLQVTFGQRINNGQLTNIASNYISPVNNLPGIGSLKPGRGGLNFDLGGLNPGFGGLNPSIGGLNPALGGIKPGPITASSGKPIEVKSVSPLKPTGVAVAVETSCGCDHQKVDLLDSRVFLKNKAYGGSGIPKIF